MREEILIMPRSISQNETMLFSPYRLDGLVLPNRIVMAPMTRSRAQQPGDVPTYLNALYYRQRASAGLIITEAAHISPEGKGCARTPGMHSAFQRDGWRLVTDAVHDAGGRIFLQLWHAGRLSHSSLQPDGGAPIAPSAIRAGNANVYATDADGLPKMIPVDKPPRALETIEITRVVDDFRRAGNLAMQAGFDGVEVHSGGGYLIEQFLRSTTNRRVDRYGGAVEKRVRFFADVTRAVKSEVGAHRTGVCLSPYTTCEDMADPEVIDTILAAADVLEEQEIAYIHVGEADGDISDGFLPSLRKHYSNTIIMPARCDYARASSILDSGYADLVAFGRPFVANPDLPTRLRLGLPLAKHQAASLVGGGAAGYTDYPTWSPLAPGGG
jgi:N-ethylmaleimide reductase